MVALRLKVAFGPGTHAYVVQALGGSYFSRGSNSTLTSTTRTPVAYALVAARGHYALAGPAIGLSYVPTGVAPSVPQKLWPGFVNSTRTQFAIWPPADGSVPDSYNAYQNGVRINPNPIVPVSVQGVGIFYATRTAVGLTPSTTYTFTARAVVGGIESADSPPLVVTTLAGNTTPPTPPAPPTVPETYIPPYAIPTTVTTATQTVWLATQNAGAANQSGTTGPGTDNGVSGNHKLSVNCSLSYALANAIVGDVIVVTAGATYVNSAPAANLFAFDTGPIGSGAGYIYVISSEDSGYKPTGALPRYSYLPWKRYLPFVATATVAAGATSLLLLKAFAGRSGWYTTKFSSGNASGIETRQALYQNGSTSVIWNVGLQAACAANFLGEISNNVTPWDAGIPIGPGNVTNPSPTMATIQFSQNGLGGNGGFGINIHGTNLRFVGINIQPIPSWKNQVNNLQGCAAVGGQGNMLDRCILGRDNTNASTLSFFFRSMSSSGVNTVVHQCYLYGSDSGNNSSQDAQAISIGANGPLCVQNCYVEGGDEHIISGGSIVAQSSVQHDMTLRYNMSHKQTTWQQILVAGTNPVSPAMSLSRRVKNHFELKVGSRFEWYGNIFQNNALCQSSQGQGARAFPMTPRDQWSLTGVRQITSATWNAGVVTVNSTFGPNLPVGTHFSSTITNAPRAGYNGTFVCTSIGPTTFTYPLATDPGGAAGTFTGYASPPQSGGLWMHILDGNVHDNQIYGTGGGMFPCTGIDYCPILYTARIRYYNNIQWLNPAFTDDLNNQTPMHGLETQGYVTDVIFAKNTIIARPAASGYSTGVAGPKGLDSFQSGSTNTLNDRWVVTDNIIDGNPGGTIDVPGGTAPPGFGSVGGTWVKFCWDTTTQTTGTLTWDKNLFIHDASSGADAWPATTYNPIAYASVGFNNFIDNVTQPTDPSDYNVVTGPYATASTTGGPIGAIFGPPPLQFPLVGAVLVAPEDYSTVANIGKPGALVLENFPGFSFGGKNITQQVTAIKALNPNGKVFTYVDIMEIDSVNSGVGTTYHAAWVAITAYNWFLRTAFPAGSIVQSQAAQNSVNITQSRLSASNDPVRANATYRQWYATFAASYFPQNADGIFTDNFQLWPKQDGDYAESGSSQSRFNATTTQNWRNAYADWVIQAKAVAGGPRLVIGNIGDWGQGGGNTPPTPLTGYPGILDGGAYEGAMGAGFSLENTSWVSMMNNYAVIMQNMKAVNYMFFMHDHSPATDYGAMRYGLCSCLLNNGHYYFNLGGSLNSVSWFDEFDFGLGPAIAGPNNPNNTVYGGTGFTSWSQGVWRRDFLNGIVLVNPRGNTQKTVTLTDQYGNPATYWHLRGTQDPTTNNAAPVTSVTMPDPNVAGVGGSGLFLSRLPT